MAYELEHHVISTLQSLFERFGWLGVATVMVFENATGMAPSEVILGLAGWMLLAAPDAPFATVFVGGVYAALGSTLGSSVTYWLARLGGRPVIERAARWIRLDTRYIAFVEYQFRRWGPGLVFFGRITPVVRILVNVPAGLARMPFLKFFMLTLAGTYVWSTGLIALGYTVGHEWQMVSDVAGQYTPWLIGAVVGLLLLGLVLNKWIVRRLPAHMLIVDNGSVDSGGVDTSQSQPET